MPVYDAFCSGCSTVEEYIRTVDNRLDTPPCGKCGGVTTLAIFKAPKGYVQGKFEPFRSTVDGTIIKNHNDMREHNKRNDVVCLADGYSDAQVKAATFRKPVEVPITTKEELAADIMAATIEVRDGYKPEVQYED